MAVEAVGAPGCGNAAKERGQTRPDAEAQSSDARDARVDESFDDDAWLFEIKWDGYRAVCTIEEKKLTLISRNGLDMLARFPGIADLRNAFASVPVVVDGEIVSLDSKGRSAFQRLQESQKKPAGLTFAAFDLLYADGTRSSRSTRSRSVSGCSSV